MSLSISKRRNFATVTAACAVMMAALMVVPATHAQQEQMPGTVNGPGSRLNGGEQSQAQPQSGGATAPGAISNTGVSPTLAPQNTNVNASPSGPVYPGLTPNPALSSPSGSAMSNQTGTAPTGANSITAPGAGLNTTINVNGAAGATVGSSGTGASAGAASRPAGSVNAGGTPQMQDLPLPPGMTEF